MTSSSIYNELIPHQRLIIIKERSLSMSSTFIAKKVEIYLRIFKNYCGVMYDVLCR